MLPNIEGLDKRSMGKPGPDRLKYITILEEYMKHLKFNKKLSLNKKTIVDLNVKQMKHVQAGDGDNSVMLCSMDLNIGCTPTITCNTVCWGNTCDCSEEYCTAGCPVETEGCPTGATCLSCTCDIGCITV